MYNAFNSTSLYNPVNPGFNNFQSLGKQEIVKVSGENGARAFQMNPNSSALLLDINQPIVWLVQTDGAGYKTINAYKIEPYVPEASESSDLERRIKRLEEIINESDIVNIKSKQQQKHSESVE